MLSENIINKIYYDYIPLYMRPFFYIHYQVKYYMIHQELKEIYLNLTENIFDFEFEFIHATRLPRLI